MTDQSDGAAARPHRVVIVGGGASGALVAIQLLREGGDGLEILVVEPRDSVGPGVAFSAGDPWHRLNVPAVTMGALPDDPDHFRRWADVPATSFPGRALFGRYIQALLAESIAGSEARFRHVRALATSLDRGPRGLAIRLASGESLAADALVVATGNERPAVPGALAPLLGDSRLSADPWSASALVGIDDDAAVAIVGTGHTALDLAASVLRRHPRSTVVALSRHGDLPRAHEDPWRPRLPVPAFSVEEFLAFADPLADGAARLRSHGDDWRRALDSLRPITPALWMVMDDDLRRRFMVDWRRTWEIHRSRVSADVMRDVEGWIGAGRLEVRPMAVERVSPAGRQLRMTGGAGEASIIVDHVLLATGPNEDPTANAFLAAAIADGLLRPGPQGIGLDADPATWRARDASGTATLPIFALGPLVRGAVWESIAIPEIRDQAAHIAAKVLAGVAAGFRG
jgi:uncharacterized NAD(P)/FAD-binding protein YdhS